MMDGNSASKAEGLKPVLLKAGIPLALSVAAFMYARIMAKRSAISEDPEIENQVRSVKPDEELNSESSIYEEDEEIITNTHFMNSIGVSEYQEKVEFDQEILRLRNRIEELEKRERELKRQLVHYHDLKEQESMLMEIRYMLLLEKAYVELLDKEISSMEAESNRLENLMVEYFRVLEQLQYWKSESGLLKRKVKKLLKKTKEQSCIIREKNLKIEAIEEEILRNHDLLERKSNSIKILEDEVRESQSVIDQLQEQKSELLSKLELADQAASKLLEDEGITIEDYKQLINEHEQLQKNRAAEVKELIYLRWANACLRHELTRNHAQQQQEENQDQKKHIAELEFEGCGECGDYGMGHHLGLETGETCLNVANGSGHACSKKPKLLQKLKRWVEGSEKMKSKLEDKEKHEVKCFGRHSVCDEPEEEHVNIARKSFSSA